MKHPTETSGTCIVGPGSGPGYRLGFRGWGEYDVELDAALPLDMQVERLGLKGAFQKVECPDLLHRLHGDCVLTHGIQGLANLLAPGGELHVEFLGLSEIIGKAAECLSRRDFVRAQAIEKIAFGQAPDASGLLYPQTMINEIKLSVLFLAVGLSKPEFSRKPSLDGVALLPDHVRLDGIEDKVWAQSERNFTYRDSLYYDRPKCLLCDRVAARRDHDRQFFSRYCKNHYHAARVACDEGLRAALSYRAKATRKT